MKMRQQKILMPINIMAGIPLPMQMKAIRISMRLLLNGQHTMSLMPNMN